MPSQGAAGGTESRSPLTSTGPRRAMAQSGQVPVTVKQLSNAKAQSSDESNFTIDGQDVNSVTLVGKLLTKEHKSTYFRFILDDGTGKIELQQWSDEDEREIETIHLIKLNTYVRIHGLISSFQGERNVRSHAIRPITDHNEVTFHFLDCIFVHLYNSKNQGLPIPSDPGAGARAGAAGVQSPLAARDPLANGVQNGNQYVAPRGPAGESSLTDLQLRVSQLYEASAVGDAGLHYEEVAKRIPGYSKEAVRAAIDFLVNEGTLYSTIDDDHFKHTSS